MPFGLNKVVFRSLWFRLAVQFTITFLVCLLGAFSLSYYLVQSSLEKASRQVIAAKWREMASHITDSNTRQLSDYLAAEANRHRNASFMVRVVTENASTLYLKAPETQQVFEFDHMYSATKDALKIPEWQALQAVGDEDRFDILTEPVGSGLYLQVGRSSEDREAVLSQIMVAFSSAGLALFFFSSLIGAWYAKNALFPIRQLVGTMKSIEQGDLSKRVAVSTSADELQDLGVTFNKMVDRIERLVTAMKDSLDNVAHDVRTPLTRIRNIVEKALMLREPDLAFSALEECSENVSELTQLINQLLDISEAQAGVMKIRAEKVNIKDLIDQVLELYEFVAEEKRITMTVAVDPMLSWSLDRRRMKQVVANLIDNAIKFSPEGSKIEVAATTEQAELRLSVSDQGIGVPTEERERIWDRLYRGDKSRSTAGLGLGLAIVRSIVEAHLGTVTVQGNSPRGSRFVVILP